MGAFLYRLEQEDGTPADPPKFRTAVPDVEGGRHDPLGTRTFWVVGVRDNDADQPPARIVEDV
jgi:hypothetical protein